MADDLKERVWRKMIAERPELEHAVMEWPETMGERLKQRAELIRLLGRRWRSKHVHGLKQAMRRLLGRILGDHD